ncbi:MAG: hypothetical protein ACSLE9_00785 [Burkholderiaceae bacterium]
MALAAAQVIDAVAARISGATACGTNVFTSRAWPIGEEILPAARITGDKEEITGEGLGDRLGQHLLDINAAFYARAVADLDDALHALAVAALPAIFAAPVPYGLTLQGIDRKMAKEGEAAVGVITLRLQALFFTVPSAPETILSS